MANKIKLLNDLQIAQFKTYMYKWIRIGLNTEPTDVPAAEAAVKLCYELAGLTAPQSIICTDSPLSAIILDNQVSKNHVSKNHVNNQVYQVWNQVYDQVSNQVRDLVSNQVSNQVWNQVWNRTQINQCYGCHDAGWLSYYDYLREVCGLVKETEKLTGLIAIAKCCGCHTKMLL